MRRKPYTLLFPHNIGGNMEIARVKMDSKGRIRIPLEMREGLGETVVLKKTPGGIIVSPGGGSPDFLEEYRAMLLSDPPRTGQPENWPPEKMKAIWK